MKRTLVSVGLLAVIACGNKSSPPAAGSGSAQPVTAVVDAGAAVDAGAKAAAAKPKAAPITKAARADYKAKLSAGRTLAKAAKSGPRRSPRSRRRWWRSLATSARWASCRSRPCRPGNHAKARTAGRQAVLTTTNPKLKAAALYNLGRVEEQAAAPAKAAALYRESLALRPNKTVEKRLAELGGAITTAPTPPACATPMPADKLCDCLLATVADDFEPDDERACSVDATGVDGWQTVTFATSGMNKESEVAVAAKVGTGWAVVGYLAAMPDR